MELNIDFAEKKIIKMVTQKQKKELRNLAPELRKLKRELNAVKSKGMFNITFLLNQGLIKEHTLKKGRIEQGRKVGYKRKWILTEKGKRMYQTLSSLGF